jgi:hypothetical protein
VTDPSTRRTVQVEYLDGTRVPVEIEYLSTHHGVALWLAKSPMFLPFEPGARVVDGDRIDGEPSHVVVGWDIGGGPSHVVVGWDV